MRGRGKLACQKPSSLKSPKSSVLKVFANSGMLWASTTAWRKRICTRSSALLRELARGYKVLRASVRALEEGLARVSPEARWSGPPTVCTLPDSATLWRGGSGQVARDAAHQFLRIGVRASVFDDGQLMLMSAALLRRGDVVMAFSHSGQTAVVVEAARQARQNGAHLIALTSGQIPRSVGNRMWRFVPT